MKKQRKKRSVAEWQALFAEHTVSGVSAAAFCRERNICAKHFSLRKKQLSMTQGKVPAASFVKAQVIDVNKTRGMTLRYGQTELQLPDVISTKWLAELIKQLA